MKKLLDELEVARDSADSIKEAQAVQLCINIVRAHNPWHEVGELPERSEMRTVSIDVILRNDLCKHNTRVVGYYHYSAGAWAYNDGDNYFPTHWAYLPEVKP